MLKRHKPEEIVAKLRQVDVLSSQGQSVADAVRSVGVTRVAYCRRRQEHGGLKSDQVRRLKALEIANRRVTLGERVCGKLQRPAPGRVPEREIFYS